MKFRFGLIIGIGAGYVLGTRAGYERYQQIQSAWRSVRRSDPAQRFTSEVRDFADKTGTSLQESAAQGVDQLTEQLRQNKPETGGGASGSTGTSSTGTSSTGTSSTGTSSTGDSATSEMDRMR